MVCLNFFCLFILSRELTNNYTKSRFHFAAYIAILFVHIIRTFATVARTIFRDITIVTGVTANKALCTKLQVFRKQKKTYLYNCSPSCVCIVRILMFMFRGVCIYSSNKILAPKFKLLCQVVNVHWNFKIKLTLQLSQHNPAAHWASVFSLHVMLSQHGSFSHSSLVPQSHSSSSSTILLPQFRRSISNW